MQMFIYSTYEYLALSCFEKIMPSLVFKYCQYLLLFVLSFNLSAESGRQQSYSGTAGAKLLAEEFGTFDSPWAMSFLPDGKLVVTEKAGKLLLVDVNKGTKLTIQGVPEVVYGGQGGLGGVIVHPQFSENNWLYLSYVEAGASGKRGAVVIRAQLKVNSATPTLENIEFIWRQFPKVSGHGHYSHCMAFSPNGQLFITSGDRQKQTPAQDWHQNLGKVIRLNADGSVPKDNPFQLKGELAKTFWSIGHRNMLGMAFDKQGRLWTHEMGPRDGDELNLTLAGRNYGWPIVSEGEHYSGVTIAAHNTRPEFHAPAAFWVPTIAPSGLVIYHGAMFAQWQGNAFIGGLRSQALLRIKITGDNAVEAERFAMDKRIREVEQGPDGALWILEDGPSARLLKLTSDK